MNLGKWRLMQIYVNKNIYPLADETNVNTIIYNDIKKDREKEKKNYYEELDKKKKNGLSDLKIKSLNVKNSFQKCQVIEKIKSNISKNIKNKILKSFKQKEGENKMFDIPNIKGMNLPPEKNGIVQVDNDEDKEEEIDNVLETDIKLDKSLKKSLTSKNSIKKPTVANKRVSKGNIFNVDNVENSNEIN